MGTTAGWVEEELRASKEGGNGRVMGAGASEGIRRGLETRRWECGRLVE